MKLGHEQVTFPMHEFRGRRLVAVLLALASLLTATAAWTAPEAFQEGVALLFEKDFDAKGVAVDRLAESGDERALPILEAMLNGRLHYLKRDRVLVISDKDGRQYRIADALTGEQLGTVKSREIAKVRVNNALRSRIRARLATLDLVHPEPDRRLAAATQLLDSADPQLIDQLRGILEHEPDARVRETIEITLALAELQSEESSRRMAGVAELSGNIHPTVRGALRVVAQSDADEAVQTSARKALRQIEFKLQFYRWAETAFFGLSLGSVLVLAAIGLAITFGVMGVINMAHGELIMIGAYTTYVIQTLLPDQIGVSVLLAVPAAFLVSGLVGIAIERGVIRFLYGRPLETLLATFGISLVLQQTVRSIFSPLNRSVSTPQWMSGSWEINSVLSLTLNRLYILLFCLMVFAALYAVLKRTPLGLQVRAVSQNRAMARAMGVRSDRVDALTFGLGSGIAGVAGVALSQLTNVGPNLGQSYIIDSFMVVVFGGVGNLWGTLVGGLSLGVANKFLEPWSGAVLAKIIILAMIILFIQKRPRGLFPQKGRAAES